MKQDKITRRKFVAGTTGAALSAMIVPRHVLGGVGYNAPSDTVNFALIGCGGQGKTDSGELVAGGQNLVALRGVGFGFGGRRIRSVTRVREPRPGARPPNEQMQRAMEERRARMAKLQEAYKTAKRHADFRKMLEQQKDIDAVVVATPDH